MTKLTRRDFVAATAVAGAGLVAGAKPSFAQSYPNRPIQMICPWGAGGGTDSLDRMGLAYIEFALERPQRFRLMFGGAKGQSAELDASAKAAFK